MDYCFVKVYFLVISLILLYSTIIHFVNSIWHLPIFKQFLVPFQLTSHLPDVYPLVNIQLKGYNFDILESYQSFVHNLAENMGIDVQER